MLLPVAILGAITAAWYPPALLLVVAASLALLLAAVLVGGGRSTLAAVRASVLVALLSGILLFPWPLAYLRSGVDRASLGVTFPGTLDLADVLRFHVGPHGGGWAAWGLLAAAAVPLFLATGARLAWATRGWALAFAGWAAAWVPGRIAPHTAWLAPEAPLVLAAFGLAIALGVAVSVLRDGVHQFRFGWRQPAAIIGGVALLLPATSFLGDTIGGRWRTPETTWAASLAFTAADTDTGDFRLLWAGDVSVLPLDPVLVEPGLAYTLTRNGSGDATELWRAPTTSTDSLVGQALTLAIEGRTTQLGRLLAPMGVRYLAVPSTLGPGDSTFHADASLGLRRALGEQLDLARLRSSGGLILYENLSWIPVRGVVARGDGRVPLTDSDPITAALRADLTNVRPLRDDRTAPVGTVALGERYDSRWKTAGGSDTEHRHAFGWANGFVVTRRSVITPQFGGQWERWLVVALQGLLWAVIVVRLRRGRRSRTTSGTADAAENPRVERTRRERASVEREREHDREHEWDPA